MMNTKQAFTLIELIVVITILAILSTIGFISFLNYAAESRDSKRISDITTLHKGLNVYVTEKMIVPEPSETKTKVSYSGSTLLTQGYAGESVLSKIGVNYAKDPSNETFYTYSTNKDNTKYQLLTFLEREQIAKIYLQNKSAFANIGTNKVYSKGQIVGILLDESNTPIQELGNTDIEIQNNSTLYTAVLNNDNVITESGSLLEVYIKGAQKNLFGWRVFDQNCTLNDIVIGDQVWAGCNSTLGNGFEWGQTPTDSENQTSGSIGSCYDYNGQNNADCTPGDLMRSNSLANKWYNGKNVNDDSEFSTIFGKLYTWENAVNTACPTGWSIPTDEQWKTLEKQLGCESSDADKRLDRCDGLGWNSQNGAKNRTFVNTLHIPLSGIINTGGTSFGSRGQRALLWAKDGTTTSGYTRQFSWDSSFIYRYFLDGEYGISARCIKN